MLPPLSPEMHRFGPYGTPFAFLSVSPAMRVLLPLLRPLSVARARAPGEGVYWGGGGAWLQPRASLATRAYRPLPLFESVAAETAAVESLRAGLPRRANELIDLGALRGVSVNEKGRIVAPVLRTLVSESLPGEGRHETITAFNVLLRHLHVAAKCCPNCLFPQQRCVCDRVRRVPPPQRAALWVFQHVGEFARCNNSGSLLCLVAGARRVTRGIREEQQAMLDDLEEGHESGSTVILYPCDDALDVTDVILRRRDRMGLTAARNTPLRVVVLDGTGRQARNLDRYLPDKFPRVKLSIDKEFGSDSWLNPIRMQTEAHRVCSAQAACNVLELLGENRVAGAVEDAVRTVVRDVRQDRVRKFGKGGSLFL